MYRSGFATSFQNLSMSKKVLAFVISTKSILPRITGHSFLLNLILLEVRKIAQIASCFETITLLFWENSRVIHEKKATKTPLYRKNKTIFFSGTVQ